MLEENPGYPGFFIDVSQPLKQAVYRSLDIVVTCLISHKNVLHPVVKFSLLLNARFIQTALARP
jgi:hypothetical protein